MAAIGYLSAELYSGTAASTGQPVDARGFQNLSIYLRGTGTVSAGTIIVEEASEPDYTGTWSQIRSLTASDATGGVEIAYHEDSASYRFIRARASAAVTGGGSCIVRVTAA